MASRFEAYDFKIASSQSGLDTASVISLTEEPVTLNVEEQFVELFTSKNPDVAKEKYKIGTAIDGEGELNDAAMDILAKVLDAVNNSGTIEIQATEETPKKKDKYAVEFKVNLSDDAANSVETYQVTNVFVNGSNEFEFAGNEKEDPTFSFEGSADSVLTISQS